MVEPFIKDINSHLLNCKSEEEKMYRIVLSVTSGFSTLVILEVSTLAFFALLR